MPDQSCRHKGENCPGTTLITGKNQTLAQTLAGNMFHTDVVQGSSSEPSRGYFVDSAFFGKDSSLYNIQSQCGSNSTISVSVPIPRSSLKFQKGLHFSLNILLQR
ncbi:PREDICTED: ABC transporter A family member 10-like [Populus euphratica]|uniref:ABC transporter A family member 10-like n=1 Tax=Populus euphratica TaxID=75702 RepID=A0AAJ6XCQ2_POPEU|nr:PREDICTED: ABC transporter A family member 10-like [Populus euphratica]